VTALPEEVTDMKTLMTDVMTPVLSLPAPTPSAAAYCAAVVPMSATASFDGTGLPIAGHSSGHSAAAVSVRPVLASSSRPFSGLGDDSTGLPSRAAPV
jgi:hypothetical protein